MDRASLDTEQGTYVAPLFHENTNISTMAKSPNTNGHEERHVRKSADGWVYLFQIIYQASFLHQFCSFI